MQNNQWIEIVAKLTLARSILGTAVMEIDDLASDIKAGRIKGTERSLRLLEISIGDLMSSSHSIDDIAVTIPEIFAQLEMSHQSDVHSIGVEQCDADSWLSKFNAA